MVNWICISVIYSVIVQLAPFHENNPYQFLLTVEHISEQPTEELVVNKEAALQISHDIWTSDEYICKGKSGEDEYENYYFYNNDEET